MRVTEVMKYSTRSLSDDSSETSEPLARYHFPTHPATNGREERIGPKDSNPAKRSAEREADRREASDWASGEAASREATVFIRFESTMPGHRVPPYTGTPAPSVNHSREYEASVHRLGRRNPRRLGTRNPRRLGSRPQAGRPRLTGTQRSRDRPRCFSVCPQVRQRRPPADRSRSPHDTHSYSSAPGFVSFGLTHSF